MQKNKSTSKSQFNRFFKLTRKHRLVTHIRPDDAELLDCYTTSFTMDGIELNATLHLYDEQMLYDFFEESKNKIYSYGHIGQQGNEEEEDASYYDRWSESGIEAFLSDAIIALRGFCVLFYPKDPNVLEKSGQLMYPPLLSYFVEYVLFNSDKQPPLWMKEEDIETAINVITHIKNDVKNINPTKRRKK